MKTSDTQVLKENNYGYSFKVEYDPSSGCHISDPFENNDINCFIIGNNSSLYKYYNTIKFNNIEYNLEELRDLFYDLKLNDSKLTESDDNVLHNLFIYFNYTYKELFNNGIFYYVYHENTLWNLEQSMEQNKQKIKKYFESFENNDFYSWCNGEYYTIEYYKDNEEIDNVGGLTSEKYAIEYAKKEIKSYILRYEKTLDIIKDSLNSNENTRDYFYNFIINEPHNENIYFMLENFKNQQEKLLNDLIESIKFLDIKFINFEKLKQYYNFKFIQKKAYDKLEHKEIKELFDLVIDY